MIITALMLLSVSADQTVGPWKIACESDTAASDGLFDRCRMEKSVDGVQMVVVRTATEATFVAKISGCMIKVPVEPIVVSQDDLAGENGKNMFVGGQLKAIIANKRQCPQSSMVLSVGGPEVPELLAATSKLRSLKN